jgi:anti-anti-sigma factor
MAAAQGTVRYCKQDRTVTFRVEGRGTMTQSLPLRRCAERFLEDGATRILVDLRDCSYMDSTFLGTLLTIGKATEKRGQGSLNLLAPSPACVRILQQMGLSDVLPSQACPVDPAATWTELSCEVDDAGMLKSNIAQAHRELASLPGPAGEQFQAVARCMADAEKNAPPPPPATHPPR